MSSLRRYLRLETALLVLVVVAAIVLIVLNQQRGNSQQEQKDLQAQLAKTRDSIASVREEVGKLQAELAGGEAAPPQQTFISLPEALDVGARLTAYAADQAIQVSSFDSAQVSVPVGEAQRPAISYALEAQGQADSLIGFLDLVQQVPTAVVEDLRFAGDPEAPDQWSVTLALAVIFER